MTLEHCPPSMLARYPFLSSAPSYIREKAIVLDAVLYDRAYSSARQRARNRLIEAINDGTLPDAPFSSESECILELISYVVSRMIVSCINDPYLIRRYALAEAVLAKDRLIKEDLETIIDIASELGVEVLQADDDGATCSVHFGDFLKHSSEFRSSEWKLTNQDMKSGRVILSKEKCARLLQNALKAKFEGELPLEVTDEIVNVLAPLTNEVKSTLEAKKREFKMESFADADMTKLPPCMKKLLAMMHAGMNLPHTARFALTSFLHKIGMSSEEILALFSRSPDFDASLARYQIEHITGVTSGTEYSPPECSTMKSYGNCYEPDNLCKKEWMTSPLYYYKIKSKPYMSKREENKGG